ncbi:MAG: YbaN family protein [Turicibacter sp.]|nr:YbaN family protein [Turicibacter sp.]
MSFIKKFLILSVGIIALGLGILGVFLPILPTVPFLLLTSYCFVRGSDRFDDWFRKSNLYKKYLEDFITHRRMALKKKWMILLPVSFCLAVPFFLFDILAMRIGILTLVIFKYSYFLFRIETANPSPIDPKYPCGESAE